MRVLITGGAGFIGSCLARRLLDDGAQVAILDNFSPQIHGGGATVGLGLDPRAEVIRGDVRDAQTVTAALRDVEILAHFAAETGTGQSMYELTRYTDVNAGGTGVVLQAVVSGAFPRLRRLLVASSRAVYGEGKHRCAVHGAVYPPTRDAGQMARGDFELHCPQCGGPVQALPTDESTPPAALSIYGLTKYFQEQAVLLAARLRGLDAFALRYQNVYGPGQSLNNPYTGILPVFSNLARAGAPINVFEDGLESRDFVYIDDAVEATVRCLASAHRGQHVMNVGTGAAISVLAAARAITAALGSASPIEVTGDFRAGDIRHNFADVTRLRETLGFAPQVTFADGLRRFLEWVQQQQVATDAVERYRRSLAELRERGVSDRPRD